MTLIKLFYVCLKLSKVAVSSYRRTKKILSQTYTGPKQDELMLVSSSQCVKVCCQFGIYLRFRVESPSTDAESSTLATPCPNVFTVLTAAQVLLQMGDDGLPHRKTVKDGRGRLYNDILRKWVFVGNSPLMYGADGHHDSIEERATEACLSLNQQVVCTIMDSLPIYQTRAMKQEFVNHYGLLMTGTKPCMLRCIYKELTKDLSCYRTTPEEEINQRVTELLSSEDLDIVVDLREMNEGCQSKYDLFWEKCSEYLAECTAVPDRQHGEVCLMAVC